MLYRRLLILAGCVAVAVLAAGAWAQDGPQTQPAPPSETPRVQPAPQTQPVPQTMPKLGPVPKALAGYITARYGHLTIGIRGTTAADAELRVVLRDAPKASTASETVTSWMNVMAVLESPPPLIAERHAIERAAERIRRTTLRALALKAITASYFDGLWDAQNQRQEKRRTEREQAGARFQRVALPLEVLKRTDDGAAVIIETKQRIKRGRREDDGSWKWSETSNYFRFRVTKDATADRWLIAGIERGRKPRERRPGSGGSDPTDNSPAPPAAEPKLTWTPDELVSRILATRGVKPAAFTASTATARAAAAAIVGPLQQAWEGRAQGLDALLYGGYLAVLTPLLAPEYLSAARKQAAALLALQAKDAGRRQEPRAIEAVDEISETRARATVASRWKGGSKLVLTLEKTTAGWRLAKAEQREAEGAKLKPIESFFDLWW